MWHVGSCWTRDQTRVRCIGRRILNHWTTREVPIKTLAERDVNYLGGIHCIIFFIILYYLISLLFSLPPPSIPMLHTHTHTHTHTHALHAHTCTCPDFNNPRCSVQREGWRASILGGQIHVLAVETGTQTYLLFPCLAHVNHQISKDMQQKVQHRSLLAALMQSHKKNCPHSLLLSFSDAETWKQTIN